MRRLLFTTLLVLCLAVSAQAETRAFTLFSADLPQGWDGEENMGFKSGNPNECMLILGLANAKRDGYDALVSIFVLPNDQKEDSASVANKLAPLQANASTPRPQGHFWTFNGEPRSQTFPAPGVTKVSATPDKVLIAIVQDPDQRGAEAVFASLKGLTPEAAKLLGE
ncbi:protoporphyrinogen oxidase [Desulfovibrio sp.]|uniref:protoporphyrinogen oxidase n=1 Tax=Desulfovibrio sp. TaxID=885 RepID=UPI0035AF2EFB